MNRLLNYFLLFILILLFGSIAIPFTILQVQINNGGSEIQNWINNFIVEKFQPLKNAFIIGLLLPIISVALLAGQQFLYINYLKKKMEFPVEKKLIKNYQWIGISCGGLCVLTIAFVICAFLVGNEWKIHRGFYIAGMVISGIYGMLIYLWATINNSQILYEQAKCQAKQDEIENDKNPPSLNDVSDGLELEIKSKNNDAENDKLQATSGSF